MRQIHILLGFVFFTSLHAGAQKQKPDYTALIQPFVFAQSRVMMHDVVNPPAACRYYAYGTLGAYAIVTAQNNSLPPAESFIKNYTSIQVHPTKNYDYQVAALYCLLEAGRQMLPSGYMIEEDEKRFIDKLKASKVSQATIDESIAVAKDVLNQVVQFAKTDHYNQLSTRIRYTPAKGEGFWYPTPPAYMEPVEPNWKTVRPLLLDSCSQFAPPPPVAFSKDSSSAFYRLAKEVYNYGIHPKKEETGSCGFLGLQPLCHRNFGAHVYRVQKNKSGWSLDVYRKHCSKYCTGFLLTGILL